MGKALKGITVEINGKTDNLVKALEKPNAEAASLQKELKGVNSLLKFDPKNTELLEQKQVLLKQAVQQTEEKMKLLTDAQKQLAAAGKDVNDDAYRDLQREIAATAQKLAGYNTQLKNAQEMQKKAAKETALDYLNGKILWGQTRTVGFSDGYIEFVRDDPLYESSVSPSIREKMDVLIESLSESN